MAANDKQPAKPQTMAVIGAGVIGSGWAARFIMSGLNVRLFDPGCDIERKVSQTLASARRAIAGLYGDSKPEEGSFTLCDTLADAVESADYVQESGPENLATKQTLLSDIARSAPGDAIIASSTSGLLPSDLQADMLNPERFLVAHPFNPVYLLPLVEMVGGNKTDPVTLERTKIHFTEMGMKPLIVRREIEAFIADRLMEALWREALWLVHDDIATAEEIDDAIRYGCGLRWAQMGTFQTYKMAGGEAGMRHFLAQFGPALDWPWSKLTDTPEMDDALIAKIADQTEAQAEGRSAGDLERIRDDNLIAILKALAHGDQGRGWGAGKTLRSHQQYLAGLTE